MKYRKLGKTGLEVSEIGMGTWQLADDPGMWTGADLKESLNCLYKYVEQGGNFIDTAWVYGYSDKPERHASEELIGKFFKESGKRDEIVIATKVAPKNWHWPAWKADKISDCFPNKHIEKQVEDSLRSLKVDVIDLVQFHVWHDNWANEDGWKETIQKIMKSGKVKHWGISINDYQPSNCLKTLDTGLISTIQFIFNIFHQKPTDKLFPFARENNVGLIVRVPLDEGGLTGKFTNKTVFPKGDFRTKYFGGKRLNDLVKRTDGLKKLLGNDIETLPELALRYVLSFDNVSTVIPGMRKLEHIRANTSVSDKGKLSHQLMKELEKHAWERNFYAPGSVDPSMKEVGYIE